MHGTVKWFKDQYGFATPDGAPNQKDVFIHVSELTKAKIHSLREGDRVEFDLVDGKNGRQQATNIRLV